MTTMAFDMSGLPDRRFAPFSKDEGSRFTKEVLVREFAENEIKVIKMLSITFVLLIIAIIASRNFESYIQLEIERAKATQIQQPKSELKN